MAASRFECPRCQTVFVKDIGDAAFVECPSCGALALPAGDATEGDLGRAVSGSHPKPVHDLPTQIEHSQPSVPPVSDPGAAPAGQGIFSGLLEDSGQRIEIPPAALSPSLDSPTAPSGYELPRTAEPAADPGAAGPTNADLNVDWNKDLGDFDFPSLPHRTGSNSDGPTSPFSTPVPPMQQLPREALDALAKLTSRDSSGEGAAVSSGEGAAVSSSEGDPTIDKKPEAPWSALSDEAFGDLERAFDDLALKPPVRRPGLSKDDERLLRGGAAARSGGKPPPMRKKAPEGEVTGKVAPPMPAGKKGGKSGRPRPTHFELSDEARRAAFVPLVVPSSRPKLDQGPAIASDEGDAPLAESRATASSSAEETDLVRERKERPPRPVPSAWKGLSAPIVIGLMLLALAGGGALGAFVIAPQPKPASTPRARAELKLANGNRFYDQGRFDDALGEFRAALTIDPTYSVAHRAKGTALAKLQRFDEAQVAYTEYLRLEPGALDATDVKAAIDRRGPPPTPDGG